MFYYVSPISIMQAKLNQQSQWIELIINGDCVDAYPSLNHLADAVYTFTTGYYDWDILDCEVDSVPTDISEWHQE